MCDSNAHENGADAPDPLDHEHCGCAVCEAIIEAIAERTVEAAPEAAEC